MSAAVLWGGGPTPLYDRRIYEAYNVYYFCCRIAHLVEKLHIALLFNQKPTSCVEIILSFVYKVIYALTLIYEIILLIESSQGRSREFQS